jgi:hypothetical protein
MQTREAGHEVSACYSSNSRRGGAQNYPWCEYLGGGDAGGGGRNCGFISFEQCMESARGQGNDCRQNTQYVPPPGEHSGPTAAPGARPRHKAHKNS